MSFVHQLIDKAKDCLSFGEYDEIVEEQGWRAVESMMERTGDDFIDYVYNDANECDSDGNYITVRMYERCWDYAQVDDYSGEGHCHFYEEPFFSKNQGFYDLQYAGVFKDVGGYDSTFGWHWICSMDDMRFKEDTACVVSDILNTIAYVLIEEVE